MDGASIEGKGEDAFGSWLTLFQFLTHQHQSHSPGQSSIDQIE
jgi:hypothetical protein